MTMLQTSSNSVIPAGLRKRAPALDAEPAAGHAAGILFVAPDGDVLLLRRSSSEPNYAGHWALPGGKAEDGETPEIAAAREAAEEMGREPDGAGKLLDRRATPNGMAFHTFAYPVKDKFAPKLNAEHSGYAWAPLDQLPRPLHPGVESTLNERVGIGEDMEPDDWKGLRDGFLKWMIEEEQEEEHDDLTATDSALRLALDRDSVREKSPEGHLHVALTNIAKATVNPYRGSEIPDAEALGLDPDKVYYLLRPPEELAKAAATFNGKPLLRKHKPTSADKHAKDETIGATGTDAVFEDPYLKNSLVVWTQNDIDDVESDLKKELSPGYRYRAEMTPGEFRGMRYDGVMRDLVGNHVALVKDGRQGPDVVVGDSKENLMAKPTRLAALTLGLTAAAIAPLLAHDAKIELPKSLFADITSKNFKDKKAALLAGVADAAKGKLRTGLAMDASMASVGKVMDEIGSLIETEKGVDESVSEPQHKAMEAAAHGESSLGIPKAVGEEFSQADKGKAFDAEPLKNFLKEKGLGEDDIAKACDMLPKAMAGDEETPEEKAKREAEAEDKKAADKKLADDKTAKDKAAMDNMVSKPAMDDAIKVAVAKARDGERAIRAALTEVRPYVGELTMAFDSAEDVKRHALSMLSVDGAKTLHADALSSVLAVQRKAGARSPDVDRPIAMDTAATKDFASRFPDANRIASA